MLMDDPIMVLLCILFAVIVFLAIALIVTLVTDHKKKDEETIEPFTGRRNK